MSENLLRNGGFEADWSEEESHRCLVFPSDGGPQEREVGNIFTPPHWLTWFRHDPGTWDQPEVKDAWKSQDPRSGVGPYGTAPTRVHSGEKGIQLFTFHRKHDAGFLQQVQVEPGVELRLTAWSHAWSNHPLEGHEDCKDDPRCSCGVGRGAAFLLDEDVPPLNGDPWNDAIGNFSFMLGIDPTGGTDPYADTVVWGEVAHIYNEYHEVPAVEATAQAETVTVFLRSKTLWAFKHNDAYWDDVELVAVGEEPPEEPEPVEWDYPVIEKGSKVGVHSILPNRVGDFAQDLIDGGARFPVVKAVDDLGWLPGVKEISPETIIIARLQGEWEGCGGVEMPEFDMDAHARRAIGAILDKIDTDPRLAEVVDYWEVYNEPDPPGPVGYRRLAELMIKTIELAEEHGLKIAIFSLNAGTPEWDEMEAMVATGVFGRAGAESRRGLTPQGEGGHILALHEGTFDTHDPKKWWGDTIPGSPEVEGAGALNFRYRYLYHLLKERDEVIPLVVSEWYCGDEESASTQTLVDALKWYDGEASEDYFLWAACPFTLGSTGQWSHTDYERVYPGLVEHMIAVKDRQNAAPPEGEPEEPEEPDCVPPREPYRRSYVLLPQIRDTVERLDWRVAAAIGSSGEMRTVGHSADDAGVGPFEREIVAVNPEQWGADLKAWYDEHYPNAEYRAISTESPWEMAINLLPLLEAESRRRSPVGEVPQGPYATRGAYATTGSLTPQGGDIALAQTDSRWADYDFGEHPDEDEETIGRYGCFLTGLAIILRKIYRRDVTPPLLDKLLVAARAAYVSDNMMAWEGAVPLFPVFDDQLKDDKQRSASELAGLLRDGWEIILRRADGEHFVYLEEVEEEALRIIDPLDGERKQKAASDYKGIRAAHIKGEVALPVPSVLLIGLHDRTGGEWMVDENMEGCCLVHSQVQRHPIQIDCADLQDAGITVIYRLNWGYADGTGTFPRPENKAAFVDAVVQTMLSAKGVDYFHVGNEPNNRQEWPGFGTGNEFALTPEYVTEIYNEIWQRVVGQAKAESRRGLTPQGMGPPPIDPYFGPNSNNRTWWIHILENIIGADALFLHSKTQTNDPAEVWSEAKFSHEPLTWQYLHLRTVETSLEVVPERFRPLPVFVTELNPQHLQAAGGAVGWQPDNSAWVQQAIRYFREEQPVTGVVFYRYEAAGDQAPFGLENKPIILDAIKAESRKRSPVGEVPQGPYATRGAYATTGGLTPQGAEAEKEEVTEIAAAAMPSEPAEERSPEGGVTRGASRHEGLLRRLWRALLG